VTYSQAIGEIISFGLWMRKQGYRESTIQPCIRALQAIAKRANLLDAESVKSYLGSAQLSEFEALQTVPSSLATQLSPPTQDQVCTLTRIARLCSRGGRDVNDFGPYFCGLTTES
jgi:hypothetical protein